jgi:hypothetical protein
MNAAIAMDIIATHLSALPRNATVLHDMVVALRTIAALGGADDRDTAMLIEEAQARTGEDRALLSQQLSACLAASIGATVPEAAASTPSSVFAALERIETCARMLVREGCLILASQQTTRYLHA